MRFALAALLLFTTLHCQGLDRQKCEERYDKACALADKEERYGQASKALSKLLHEIDRTPSQPTWACTLRKQCTQKHNTCAEKLLQKASGKLNATRYGYLYPMRYPLTLPLSLVHQHLEVPVFIPSSAIDESFPSSWLASSFGVRPPRLL